MLHIKGAWAQSLDNDSSDLVVLGDSNESKDYLLAPISRIATDKNNITVIKSGIKAIILKNELILEIPSKTKDALNRDAPVVVYGILDKGKNNIVRDLTDILNEIAEKDGREIKSDVITQAAEVIDKCIDRRNEDRKIRYLKRIAAAAVSAAVIILWQVVRRHKKYAVLNGTVEGYDVSGDYYNSWEKLFDKFNIAFYLFSADKVMQNDQYIFNKIGTDIKHIAKWQKNDENKNKKIILVGINYPEYNDQIEKYFKSFGFKFDDIIVFDKFTENDLKTYLENHNA